MTPSTPPAETSASASRRRLGYAISITVNAVLLGALLGWPGWEVVPFLNDGFSRVVGWFIAGIAASITFNALHLLWDPPTVRALGQLVTDALGLTALIRLLRIFPFEFTETSIPWAMITRTVLVTAVAATAIAMVVSLVRVGSGAIGTDGSDVDQPDY